MSYELYCFRGACSMAVHVLLHELNQKVDVHYLDASKGEHKSPEYLKINPCGKVPVLIEDGKAMSEGAAQIVYLCDKHKSDLIPSDGWARGQALQWLMFCNSSLHPAYARTFWLNKALPKGEVLDNALKEARSQIQGMWDIVEGYLAGSKGDYLCGDKMTAGDILMTVIANWSSENYKFGPKCKALFKAVTSRPAYQAALEHEQVEYKAAA